MAKYILASKSIVTFDDFDWVRHHIEELISFEECKAKVDKAVAEVKSLIKGKKAGYCWSGGKDSLALQVIMEQAGVVPCVLCTCHEMSPSVLKWNEENAPKGLEISFNEKLTKQYIKEHIDKVFPTTNRDRCWWYKQLRWDAQKKFVKKHSLEICFWGRRSQDNNMCYRNGSKHYYDEKIGCIHSNIIADWKHEDVIAAIHYYLNDKYPAYYDVRDCKNGMPEHLFWFERHSWADVINFYPDLEPTLRKEFPMLVTK